MERFAAKRYATLEEEKAAFWALAMPEPMSGCYLWIGGRAGGGKYGCWRDSMAHRVAFEFANGRPPKPGLVVRHSCDNPMCVNPRHLKEGTVADNMMDMANRGRSTRVLAVETVKEIIKLTDGGMSLEATASECGVSYKTVWSIVNGKTWSNVTGRSP